MIKFHHRIFLSSLALMNISATSTFFYIYHHVIEANADKMTQIYINTSFGLFVFMLWVLFITILYYAKTDDRFIDR